MPAPPDNYYRTIAALFQFSRRKAVEDNLPYSLKHGGRNKFGELFNTLGFKEGAEIGTKRGEYAKILCEAIPGLHLTCIDPWDAKQPYGGHQHQHNKYMEAAKRNLAPYNVTILRKTSLEALPDIKDGSLDFVYIDGNHEFDYIATDVIFWSHKVRTGGIVSGHDYFQHRRGGVVKAIDAYTHSHNINPWYVTEEVWPSWFWVKP